MRYTGGEKGGFKRRETDLGSTLFPKFSSHPRTPTEIHRIGLRKEWREGGNRGNLGEKKGELKGGESDQTSNHTPE